MPAFRFSLAPLLERQTALEAAKRRELLGAEQFASREREAVVSLEVQLRALGSALTDDGRAEPSALRQTLLEIELVRTALVARQRAAGAANERAGAARDAYVAARREHERLQALYDRAYRAFLVAEDRREAAELDEANARGGTLSP